MSQKQCLSLSPAVPTRLVQLAMQLVVHTQALLPLALASAHAATDFAKPPLALAPYLLLLVWPPAVPVTPVFFAASVVHFGRDVGAEGSVKLHALWMLVAAVDVDAAFLLFEMYYSGVHAPLHCARHARHWRLPAAAALLCALTFAAAALTVGWTPPASVALEEWMQRLVVAHVVCDEMGARGGSR